jgi:N6-adenosine-specific RNA methylase IME4
VTGIEPPFNSLDPPYGTIVADPPWPYPEGFPTQSRTPGKWTGDVTTTTLPYSAMTLDQISALPVRTLAAPACRLFLWTTNRYLPDAFHIAADWGFRYRQALVWHKLDGNMGGSVAPCSAEFLLVCVRGAPPVLSKVASAVIATAQSKQHSRKPAAFGDLVETVSGGPYVELFAREPRLGWDSWGYGYETDVADVG